jgi:hypothetical protein
MSVPQKSISLDLSGFDISIPTIERMENNNLSLLLGAANNLLEALQTSDAEVLADVELQKRIREIYTFERTRLRKRTQPSQEPIHKLRQPIENFTDGLTNTQKAKFMSAVRSMQYSAWTTCSPLFEGFTFPSTGSALASLLGWCANRKTDFVREIRVLTVIVEAYIHEEAEMKEASVGDVYIALTENTGWKRRQIEDLSRCGQWHMGILESENLGLGALAILGDTQYM